MEPTEIPASHKNDVKQDIDQKSVMNSKILARNSKDTDQKSVMNKNIPTGN